jgi:hypothetical protein
MPWGKPWGFKWGDDSPLDPPPEPPPIKNAGDVDMSLRVVITVQEATLPEEQRDVLLTGLAADLATQLAAFYSGINVQVEDTWAQAPNSPSSVTHEITSAVSGAYFPVYGGS